MIANPHPKPAEEDEAEFVADKNEGTLNRLTMMQWNADAISSKKEEFKNFILENKIDIYLLQETKLTPKDSTPSIPGYTVVRKDREQLVGQEKARGGGVLIGIRDTIPFRQANFEIRSEDDKITEWATIEIPVRGKSKIRITNLYIPPASSNPGMISNVKTHKWPRKEYDIVLGDINAHSILWDNSARPDERGAEVEEWLAEHDMHCLNSGEPTQYSKGKDQYSSPDVSMVHSSRLDKFTWKVLDELGSNHKPLLITYEDDINVQKVNNQAKYKWKINKADWESYTQEIENKLPEQYTRKNINKLEKILRKAITKAAQKHIGVKKVDNRAKPWMTEEIKVEIKNRNELSRSIPTNRKAWVEACQKVSHMIKEEKTKRWKEYVESLEQSTPDVQVWRTIRQLDGRNPPPNKNEALVVENKAYISDTEKARQFGKTYKNFSQIPTRKSDRKIRKAVRKALKEGEEGVHESEREITMHEMSRAIHDSKANKAAGDDGIPYELIKHLGPKAKQFLLMLYNKCWIHKGIPRKWRTAIICPLLKHGKDPKDTISYRPISLTSCLGKILEKIVADRMIYVLENRLQLTQNQAGFRQGRSTTDQILKLTQSVIDKFHGKAGETLTITTFFDYAKAYNKVWRDGLLYKMNQLGIPLRFIWYVRNFLSGRKTQVAVNNKKCDPFYLNEGLPQGSAISPLLFLIFINDIDADLDIHTIASLFADDTAIWTQGERDKEKTAQKMQIEVQKIEAWAEKWKMSLNADKTRAMIFSTSGADNLWDPELTLNGTPVKTTKEYIFLGTTFDGGLRFTKHLEETVRRGTKRVNVMRCLAGKDWGQDNETLRKIYLAYIRGCLEYASPSWWTCISETNQKKLERIQNAAMRVIAGLYKTCHVDFLRLETNLEPLNIRMDKIDRIQQEKYNRLPDHDDRRKLLNPDAPSRLTTREGWSHSVMKHQMQEVMEEERNLPGIPPWEEMTNLSIEAVTLEKPKAEYTEAELKERAVIKIASFRANYTIYTDGSTDSNQENGGAGVFIHDEENNTILEEAKPAGKLCSSYAGECAALFHALTWMKETSNDKTTHPERLHFLVCTDSRSLCDALRHVSWKDRDYWIVKIQMLVLSIDADITLLWIPSHCDVEGNEKADDLAKTGSNMGQEGVPVSEKIVKAKIKNQKWEIEHQQAKDTYGDRRNPKAEVEKKWPRKIRALFSRLCTGHAMELKHYRHFIGQEEDPNCETCGVPEDIEHVLCHCAATEEARVRNWYGKVTTRMMTEEPEVCRKILGTRFNTHVAKDQ